MNKTNVHTLAKTVHGKLVGSRNKYFRFLLTDSRALSVPGETAFFALKGINHDGHHFINELYQLGVEIFVVQELPHDLASFQNASFVVVEDTWLALQAISAWHRRQFQYPVIGITGSNGKTIVKEWCSQILSGYLSVVKSPKSYNSQTGVPLSVWRMHEDADIAVIEAGISQPGEMQKLADIIKPDIGIFTGLGEAHQENFRDYAHKLQEKWHLFANASCLVFSVDHPELRKRVGEIAADVTLCTWTEEEHDAKWKLSYEILTDTSRIFLCSEDREFCFEIPFTNVISVHNAVNAFLAALEAGVPGKYLLEKMPHLSPVAMRMEVLKGMNQCTLINDSYNSDPSSVRIAIDFAISQNESGIVLILSDILQAGTPDKLLYRQIAELIEEKNIDMLIGIGPVISSYLSYFRKNDRFYKSTEAFIRDEYWMHFHEDTILLKGARPFAFERISSLLAEKAHQTLMEIRLDRIVSNMNAFRALLPESTRLMVMVKAFSYGSGYVEIARILQYQRVDYLGVAIADEGVDLRKSGISVPVMVMNPRPESFEKIIEYNLEPEIYSLSLLRTFLNFLETQEMSNYPVHIKLDTGMHRLGFEEDSLEEMLHILSAGERVQVRSVFSHLAASDDPDKDAFTRRQIAAFDRMYVRITKTLQYQPMRHISNTHGILRFPEAAYEMVRLGIGLYGIAADTRLQLEPVAVFKTRVSQIRHLAVGETVSYNRSGVIENPSKIATLPVGYADGFDRRLGNGNWQVEINGRLAPTIGDVCMDMCMVNVTGLDISEGDSVIIFGGRQTVKDMAEAMQTIPYEVLTNISQRVKRVYYHE